VLYHFRVGTRPAAALPTLRLIGGLEAEMHKHAFAIVGCLAALAAATSASAAERNMNLSRNAKSGVDSPLAYSNPANGTVSVVDAEEVLPASTPGSGNTRQCAGKTIQSKKIMYLSNPGFRGSDTLSYDSEGAGTILHTIIAITVQ
jgi:hypothetical protein